jgi:lipid-binding SYLF domain-containing protein
LVLGGAAAALSPLVAATQEASQNVDQSAADHASGPQKLVDESTEVVKHMQQDPDLGALLARAQGVLIVPKYGKGAFVVGARSGEGVLLVHENGGRWSNPAFYNLAGGAQIGGEVGPIAYILMSPHAVGGLAGAKTVALNPKAGFTIATWSKQTKGDITKGDIGAADVVLWSGAAKWTKPKPDVTVSGKTLTQDFAANDQYYRARNLDTVAVLQGRVFNPGAAPLQEQLSAFG